MFLSLNCLFSLILCPCSYVLLCFSFTSNMAKPAKVSLNKIRLFNLRWLQTCCINGGPAQTGGWTIFFEQYITVWVCAGEPVGGGPSAEAERGVVRSDPWPQPACWSCLRITTGPQETASPPGESGQRASTRNHHAHCQNTAAATGANKARKQTQIYSLAAGFFTLFLSFLW